MYIWSILIYGFHSLIRSLCILLSKLSHCLISGSAGGVKILRCFSFRVRGFLLEFRKGVTFQNSFGGCYSFLFELLSLGADTPSWTLPQNVYSTFRGPSCYWFVDWSCNGRLLFVTTLLLQTNSGPFGYRGRIRSP